jgi:hypothetical protein
MYIVIYNVCIMYVHVLYMWIYSVEIILIIKTIFYIITKNNKIYHENIQYMDM